MRDGLHFPGGCDGSATVLAVERVAKAFGATQALEDVSLELRRGSVHALLGGNGSGKSTLIKAIAGVEPADAGELEVRGGRHDLRTMTPALARQAGLHFVHQQRTTFPALTVAENLAIGRGFETGAGGRIEWRRARARAAAVLERFQIDAHPDAELGRLGPATQTMVAIARALQDQEGEADGVLLLDEPTASLPAPEAALLLDALRRYAAAGQAIVYVTHRLEEVFALADRATLLRDGRVVGEVEPSRLDHDALVELMMGRSVEQIERLRGRPEGRVVLAVEGLAAGPLAPLDLEVRAGEIVGLARADRIGALEPAQEPVRGHPARVRRGPDRRRAARGSAPLPTRWPPGSPTCRRTGSATPSSPRSASARTSR